MTCPADPEADEKTEREKERRPPPARDKRAELELLKIEKRIVKVKREILLEEGVKDESDADGDGKKESVKKGKGGKKVTVIDLD
ncbi:hypothetical protein JCM10296v2_002073 [Rhodotorula toruloides]